MAGTTDGLRWSGVDAYVEAYESARARDGSAEVADYVPPADHPDRLPILCELVRVDLEYQWEQGPPRRLEDYRGLAPALFEDPGFLHAMAFEEYRLRLQAGECPTPADYRLRFGIDGHDWPAAPVGPPPVPAEAGGDAMEQAASVYRDYRRRGTPRPGGLDLLMASSGVGREHADFLRELDRTDPHAAERLAEAVTGFPRVGDHFLGFRLVGELGRGAFGRVYLAHQGDLADRPVALKVSADVAGESHALAQLQHTNVVPVYSVHRRGPLQAVCMPYLGATTLADTLAALKSQGKLPRSGRGLLDTRDARKGSPAGSGPGGPGETPGESGPGSASREDDHNFPDQHARRSGPAPPPEFEHLRGLGYVPAVLWLVARVADGLAHAHERGILHRDLKPANILFADDGEPLLLDFNLAADTKVRFRVSAAQVGGTLPYMAPEQLAAFDAGRPTDDVRGDLYALGVILHELLTGTHPFPIRRGAVDDVLPAMIADRLGSVPNARAANPDVSPAVASIVRHCLEPDPDLRYRSARDLQEDLRRQLADLPLRHAPEPSLRERARKWARRHPRLSSGTAQGIVAALLIAGVVAGYADRQRRFGPVAAAHALRGLAEAHEEALALLLDPAIDPARRDAGAAVCLRALARYGVADSPAWLASALVRDLPADGQAELRGRVGDLLTLWARATAGRAADLEPGRRVELARAALRQYSLAEPCFAPGAIPRAYWVQRAILARLAGDPAGAARARDRAAATPVGSPREYALLTLDDPEDAAAHDALPALAEASRRDPQDYALWMFLGQCQAHRGRLAEAEDCFTVAIALRPGSPWPYFHRGRVGVERAEFGPARLDLDRAIRLRPDLPGGYINRALARSGLGDHAGAIADLDEALGRGATETRIDFLRAEERARTGDRAGADRDRAEGLRRVPADVESWVVRGLARLPADPVGALADFEGALKLDPRSRAALRNKAAVLSEHLGRAEEAIAALDRAVALDPESAPARVGRGVLLARLGRRHAAHRDAEEARRRDPTGATTYRVACIYALTSKAEPADRPRALRMLATALGQDSAWIDVARTDPDLDPLRSRAEFKDLLATFTEQPGPAG